MDSNLFLVKVENLPALAEALDASNSFWDQMVVSGLGAFAGALFAFAFGIWQQNKQGQNEEKAKALDIKLDRMNAINYAMIALCSNLETLLAFKKQMVLPYISDVNAVETARQINMATAVATMSTCQHLHQFMQEQTFFSLNITDDLKFLATDRPVLLGLLHKVRTLAAINPTIQETNLHLKDFKNKERPDGFWHEIEIRTALQMHKAYAEALITVADNALGFIRITENHLRKYCKDTYAGEKFVSFKITPQMANYLPSGNIDHYKLFDDIDPLVMAENNATQSV